MCESSDLWSDNSLFFFFLFFNKSKRREFRDWFNDENQWNHALIYYLFTYTYRNFSPFIVFFFSFDLFLVREKKRSEAAFWWSKVPAKKKTAEPLAFYAVLSVFFLRNFFFLSLFLFFFFCWLELLRFFFPLFFSRLLLFKVCIALMDYSLHPRTHSHMSVFFFFYSLLCFYLNKPVSLFFFFFSAFASSQWLNWTTLRFITLQPQA